MDRSLQSAGFRSSAAYWSARPRRLCLGMVVAAALMGCGSDGPSSPTPPPPQVPSDPNTVSMTDNTFTPGTRTVAVGTTVRWVNNGGVAHNTTSATAGLWASANLAPGAEFSRTFSTAGTFAYSCTLHAGMAGSIVVQ